MISAKNASFLSEVANQKRLEKLKPQIDALKNKIEASIREAAQASQFRCLILMDDKEYEVLKDIRDELEALGYDYMTHRQHTDGEHRVEIYWR